MLKAMHKKLEFQNEVVKNGDGNSGESTQTLDESLQKKKIITFSFFEKLKMLSKLHDHV